MDFIVRQLEGLDPLIEDIDRRHAQYLRTSLRQIRYQLVSADGSFKARLVRLGQRLAALLETGETRLPVSAPRLQLHPVRAADTGSFYTPPRRRAPFQPAAVVAPALRPAELVALRAATLREVHRALMPDKVNRRVLGFFNGHRRLPVSELPLDVLDDLHWLTTIIAYGHHPEVQYGVEKVSGEPVDLGPYRVLPFELERL